MKKIYDYQSPACFAMELVPESILCSSDKEEDIFTIAPFEKTEGTWD